MAYFKIDAPNLTGLMAKLNANSLYAPAWRHAMDRVADLMEAKGLERVPRRRGVLAASLTKKIDSRPVPLWAKVSFDAKASNGFRYGGALEGSQRYHYRSSGPIGRRTYHWLRGVKRLILGDARKILEAAAREIEQRWAS